MADSDELSSPLSETISHPPTPQPPQRQHSNHRQNDHKYAESTIRVGALVSDGVEDNTHRNNHNNQHHHHRDHPVSTSATSHNRAATGRDTPRHTSISESQAAAGETKIKRPRKKREPKADDAEKKPRKPRATTAHLRKKQKMEEEVKKEPAPRDTQVDVLPTRQPKMTETIAPDPNPNSRGISSEIGNDEAARGHSSLNQYAPPSQSSSIPPPQTQPQRYHYDPIRSTTIATPPQSNISYSPTATTGPPQPAFRPSASPAISSIIDPPAPPSRDPPNSQYERMRNSIGSPSNAHIILNPTPTPVAPQPLNVSQPVVSPTQRSAPLRPNTNEASATSMEVDSAASRSQKPVAVKKGTSSGPTSTAPSPKPVRAKDQPSELPQGSGLISSALFGGEGSGGDNGEAPTIILDIPLHGKSNQIVNFARMVEEKYGFAALHPRLAARKEHLSRVAAAGAALEKSVNGKLGGSPAGESGDDDMSVDIDRDSDNDGDVAMSGVNGLGTAGNSGAEGEKKRRRRKMEEYDRDDPFVDDSELAWEAQAAASKDGFFVYCGPLVPEGEKPAVER
ncbi:MAG: hypothetical protein Q9160_000819, partial [Pyrenula sp. 1 TL-2023]